MLMPSANPLITVARFSIGGIFAIMKLLYYRKMGTCEELSVLQERNKAERDGHAFLEIASRGYNAIDNEPSIH